MSSEIWKCDKCGQTFNSAGDLENHRREQHTGTGSSGAA
jgi:ribosomal protein L37AE/L43A